MIERHVYLKLKPGVDRGHLVEAARRELPRVPGVRGVRVGVPADADAEVWDVVMIVRFDRVEDVAPYLKDPLHVAFVEGTLAPNVEFRKAWNFDMGPIG